MFFSSLMYFFGLIVFCLKRKHFLSMLLSLEFIVLSLYFNLFIYLSFFSFEFYFSMIFLTMSVCEGALGLSILVMMIRSHGNDYFKSFNLLW
uniref:NADH-ubiquinone oxidoreductase chain 4L n=1 Tax=Tetartopeus terminatum TaxID=879056 RepID=A0A0S2M958_TETTM|nr:NADH dehydrogenase subunit 4L [Tetartopeus terminatus]ALO71201.1 NADH deshydrogenase subunit 4L [Tetartopeus terminatus]